MEKIITFEMTDNQAKNFENLLDEFNRTMKRMNEKGNSSEQQMTGIKAESQLLLKQIREETERIKQLNTNRRKMIWER